MVRILRWGEGADKLVICVLKVLQSQRKSCNPLYLPVLEVSQHCRVWEPIANRDTIAHGECAEQRMEALW